MGTSRANVIHGADVRVVERRNGSRLTFEPLKRLYRVDIRRQDLDGNVPFETSVLCSVDLPHAPFAEQGHDLVRAEPGARC